ncbi:MULTISPECIES: undecaprenyl-diphosphate phosphatase [Caballeronia]|uniref:Undecaprenyl-diphosphatase n=1 Tax=Caballeronia cordobensis TaxID=1353886 RepID=A0A158J3I6_CABCO|nr:MULTISPECIES: undecaprenyl-diphosphate phosphatase [Caballeronia]AET88534.1 undecaprenol kinase [Burkholderia sp. YI23]AQG98011.1 undecaprenyl-diphosphatase [Burkholderia sp. KK1]BBP95579.1 undecaprenyl-diphosphatase 2 [Burkholderia sp. SFA1]MCE4542525.1 undecaprenyl-diphosphate phosphatase [Caballeronia sp. PC1]MCE4568420.1 undecaprenyl-diphosphate phosphatase [Caballeronia sp. CLC5]
MDWILMVKALILGVVEGLTEFLPVSSTGHLIVAGSLLNFTDAQSKTFDVVIQFGAILAICWEYRAKIGSVVTGLPVRADARRFTINVIIATIPAIVLGLLFEKHIKSVLFSPVPVSVALIIGGIVILWAEARQRERGALTRVHSVDDLTYGDAFKVGLAQCFALIPGTSRSGATIIGGMLFGLERRVATEFSFFLAIPIIFGATIYEMAKYWRTLTVDDLGLFAIGLIAAFISAFVCVRWLLRYVASHDFTAFAWYRIGFGLLILIVGYSGGLSWAD